MGPPVVQVTARLTFPWKKFRLRRFRTIVALDPGWRLAEFGEAVMLKSVAVRVMTI